MRFLKTRLGMSLLIVALTVMFVVPQFTFAASLDITAVVDSLFASINTWIPSIMPIVGLGGGLTIAMLLGAYIINSLRSALGGGRK